MKRFLAPLLLIAAFMPVSGATIQVDTIWNQSDAQGMKQGYWKKNNPDGKLIYKGFFKNNQPVGKMQRFYANGQKQADLNYIEGSGYTYARLYYMNGKLVATGKYVDMKKDSIWNYFSYYSSSLSYMETYKEGQKHGKSVKYYPEGSISEILNWQNDMKHGIWKQFYEDSTLKLSASYIIDKLHDDYERWSPESLYVIKGRYIMGKMDGTWKFYNAEGGLERELVYDDGELLNLDVMEEWAQKYMDEADSNLGKIPEVDFDNFFNPK
jgi:antitoxin component YwqK of YwqJK toxin-antitoxin module